MEKTETMFKDLPPEIASNIRDITSRLANYIEGARSMGPREISMLGSSLSANGSWLRDVLHENSSMVGHQHTKL